MVADVGGGTKWLMIGLLELLVDNRLRRGLAILVGHWTENVDLRVAVVKHVKLVVAPKRVKRCSQ
mgnify:CR=1 FL=1